MLRIFLVLACTCFLQVVVRCQEVLANTANALQSINENGVVCNSATISGPCNPMQVVSTALHRDTLYFTGYQRELYRVKLGTVPSNCVQLTTFPSSSNGIFLNSLAVSRSGMLYAANAETRELYKYDPYTQTTTILGIFNSDATPGGDMIFYHDKLLLATMSNGIYEVNINNPSSSIPFIQVPSSGSVFYGLLAVPYDCDNNKYYGMVWNVNSFSTLLYELDMVNRQVLGVSCSLPFLSYDGASNVSDGNTIGITIDQVQVHPVCGNDSLADISVVASSASGGITYTIDGSQSNQTGTFSGINAGVHTLHIQNSINCSRDSVFTIVHGLFQDIGIDKISPYCSIPNGQIIVTATSGYQPISYSLDGSAFSTNNVFINLAAGPHSVEVKDGAGCSKDTVILLIDAGFPSFFASVTTNPVHCTHKNGSIQIQLAPGINAAEVTVSLNGAAPQSLLSFTDLDSGQYHLQLVYQNICSYDTIVKVLYSKNPSPLVNIIIDDQKCTDANGVARFNILGNFNPYLLNFNNSGNSTNLNYTNLVPGTYAVRITDNDGCFYDSTIIIKPYNLKQVNITIQKTDPDCNEINNGSLALSISGDQYPYFIRMGSSIYNNGTPISGLSEGEYHVYVLNGDYCFVDSVDIKLAMKLSLECERIYVPSAFTPDNDHINDIFKAYVSGSIIDFEMLIYNKIGQLVFSTREKSKGWDGKIKGVNQSIGAYVWVIRYSSIFNSQKKLLKGTLLLIR